MYYLIALAAASLARGQVQDAGSSEIRKQWVVGEHLAKDIGQPVDDAALLDYLQRIESRIASAVSARPIQIRVTRSLEPAATLLPNRILYLSSGMLARVESESELAGLLAHELAHSQRATAPSCVLASRPTIDEQTRDEEVRATGEAVRYMKLAGYDPLSAVEILSKLAYEHPAWGKAIRAEDLLDLRATLESEVAPAGGYALDSSEFIKQHAAIVAAAGQHPRKP
jgi:predicted Zn-dependent protease